jgi:hypothetical protein
VNSEREEVVGLGFWREAEGWAGWLGDFSTGDAESAKREGEVRGGHPRVFFQRVRKLLIRKQLSEYSFIESAQEIENEGFIFALFLQKSERVKERGQGRGWNPEKKRVERAGWAIFMGNYSISVLFVK